MLVHLSATGRGREHSERVRGKWGVPVCNKN